MPNKIFQRTSHRYRAAAERNYMILQGLGCETFVRRGQPK
jgi:hypothetical protein